jgi:hypothetical protein
MRHIAYKLGSTKDTISTTMLTVMLKVLPLALLGSRRFLSFLLWAGLAFPIAAQQNMAIYTDSLQNSWNNWSWGSTINFGNTSPVHSGSRSISITITNASAGLYLEHTPFDSTPYGNLTFWVNGGSSGAQPLAVRATLGDTVTGSQYNFSPTAGGWQQITVALSSLGVASQPNLDGIWIQSQTNSALSTFYVDDMTLLTNGTSPAPPGTNSVTINVDAQLNRHPISPLIYGIAFASSASQISDLNVPVHRSGGNAETRYNWLIDAHNRGADWYFESISDGSGTPGADADNFISTSKSGGADPMITIPMIGWGCKLGTNRASLSSFSVAKYGPQQEVDPYWSDAGNGVSSVGGTNIVNNPNDANFPTNSSFYVGWLQHLTNTWGSSLNGGVKYYLMDNEHSIWFSTHRDVHPIGPTMQEIRNDILTCASLVKSNDPNALVCAPEEWGWGGYFNSGYDQQHAGGVDRANNGGWDYCPWLLNQIHQHDTNSGQRLLDYFTLHCYPQEGNVGGAAVDTTTALLRNQCTRVFWDTNYVDQSWINQVIMLIPRMKSWVNAYYPGTKIGVTEYNWGAEANINGATAQADIDGIFGRESLDLATRWTTPSTGTPTYNAMKMYRNYDGNKSTFGDTSVSDGVSTNVDLVSSFAAMRSSDGALTVMVINKQLQTSSALTVNLANFVMAGTAQVWQLTSANTINRLSDVTVSGSMLSTIVPAQSITLFVLPAGPVAPPPPPVLVAPGSLSSSNTFNFQLTNGVAGLSYIMQTSSDLLNWQPLQTNTLTTSSNSYAFPASPTQCFYRAQWAP